MVGGNDHLDLTRCGDCEHAEAQAAAEIAVTRVALASLAARRQSGGKPDFVTGAGAIDRLQDQFEIEGELQFADDHDRRFVTAERHKVATADLALDRKAELLEKSFDGQIERGFQRKFLSSDRATHWLKSTPDRPLACRMIAVNSDDYAVWGIFVQARL